MTQVYHGKKENGMFLYTQHRMTRLWTRSSVGLSDLMMLVISGIHLHHTMTGKPSKSLSYADAKVPIFHHNRHH